jgi:hypothetical protein
MTDQELKDLVASLAIQSAKTDKELKDLVANIAIQSAKTDKELKDRFAQTEKEIKEVIKQIGGIAKTQGEITEEYFFNILKSDKKVSNMQFDMIEKNAYRYIKNDLKGEYDIILYNGNSVLIIEIKNKIREKDLLNLKEKQIKNFRELFPTYKEYKIYGAIAGFAIDDKIVEQAKDDGFFVLQKKGELLVEEHDKIVSY